MASLPSAAKRLLKHALERNMVSEQLRRNHRTLSTEQEAILKEALTTRFFSDLRYYPDPPESYLASAAGERDLSDHVTNRLQVFRSTIVPSIDLILPLKDASILEIGSVRARQPWPWPSRVQRLWGWMRATGPFEYASTLLAAWSQGGVC